MPSGWTSVADRSPPVIDVPVSIIRSSKGWAFRDVRELWRYREVMQDDTQGFGITPITNGAVPCRFQVSTLDSSD